MKKLAIVLTVCMITLLVLSACVTKIDKAQGYDILKDALEQSIASKTYYVTEYNQLNSNKSRSFMLNVNAGEENDKYNPLQIQFVEENKDTTSTKRNTHLFTYSLSKNIKPKNATKDDYKYFYFKSVDGEKTCEEMEAKEAFSFDYINKYSIENILSPIFELTREDINFDISDGGVRREGKTTFVRFAVTKAENKFSTFASIEIHIFNGKIVKVGTYEDGKLLWSTSDTYKIDIVYQGPVINTISYDSDHGYRLLTK